MKRSLRGKKFDLDKTLKEILNGYEESKQYTDDYLYEDRMKWIRDSISKNSIDPLNEYDLDTHTFSIGIMLAQIERYGGIVVETKIGTFPNE